MIAELHAFGAAASVAAIAAFGLAAAGKAVVGGVSRDDRFLRTGRIAVAILSGITAALGVLLFATGDRPAEQLHVLYGVAVLVVVPFAVNLTAEAPPRQRAAVLALAAGVALLIVWRLYGTG